MAKKLIRPTPYGQIICPTEAPSRRLTMIVAQEPTQSLATLHRPLAAAVRVPRKQQDVGAVANVVGIRRGAISGNMIVSAQAARSIG